MTGLEVVEAPAGLPRKDRAEYESGPEPEPNLTPRVFNSVEQRGLSMFRFSETNLRRNFGYGDRANRDGLCGFPWVIWP